MTGMGRAWNGPRERGDGQGDGAETEQRLTVTAIRDSQVTKPDSDK